VQPHETCAGARIQLLKVLCLLETFADPVALHEVLRYPLNTMRRRDLETLIILTVFLLSAIVRWSWGMFQIPIDNQFIQIVFSN
jgi:hypothetical protein